MKVIEHQDLDDLAIGCAILGSGGGGSPSYSLMMAKHEIEKYGPITLVDLSELDSDDRILPIAFAGAPVAAMEKIASGRETLGVINYYETLLQTKMQCLMAIEIGGLNAFVSLIAAAKARVPVLDGDLLGRAFPELNMSTYMLKYQIPPPMVIIDALGNTVAYTAKDGPTLERMGRHMIVALGSSVVMGMFPLTNEIAKNCLIPKTLSKAINIGKVHRQAKARGEDPVNAILNYCHGVLIASGTICDIDQRVDGGFVLGHVKIQENEQCLELHFQNEYLIARDKNKVLGTTPDILMLLEQETGTPLSCEVIRYGLKVHLIGIPAPKVWTSKKGLGIVGPRAFGYEIDYRPIRSFDNAQ